MHQKISGRPLDNKLLAALPRRQFDLLAPNLSTVPLKQGEVLAEPGDEFEQVYFPESGMLSLLAVLRDGKAIETATVGREGVVGAMAGLRPLQVARSRCRSASDDGEQDFCIAVQESCRQQRSDPEHVHSI